jgi:uncharacterized protein (DUF608 family)
VTFDFETGDLQGWQVTSGRFGRLINDRAMCRNTPNTPYPKTGTYYMSTTELPDGNYDDAMTGEVESPVIRMSGPRVSLRIGGGAHRDTRVVLRALPELARGASGAGVPDDGTEIVSASGENSEQMRLVQWSLPELRGRLVYLVVEDGNEGGWGHVTMDEVTIEGQVDEAATARHRASAELRRATRAERERKQAGARAEARRKHREQLLTPEYLTARGSTRTYSGPSLAAVSIPMGGIGTGCVQMSGEGRLALWQIWGNHKAVSLPNSYLLVKCGVAGKPPVLRRLERSSGRPAPNEAHPSMASVRFRGEYPFGWWSLSDPALPVKVEVEAFSPLIPGNAADSAIPCVVFRVTVTNTGKASAAVSVGARQQNAVGCDPDVPIEGNRSPAFGRAVNRNVVERGRALVVMSKAGAPDAGTMAVCALGPASRAETARPGPSPTGETLDSTVWTSMRLRPGEMGTREIVLAWHAPSAVHGGEIAGWTTRGYAYQNRYADAGAVARDVAARLAELLSGTTLYHATLYESNLPVWLLDRISSQVAVLRSPTVFWGRDGYFGGWEGCSPGTGCCPGNCSHVWHYAQAHARLFPEIGRIMREQELRWMKDDGAVPHRQPDAPPAFDGQCGTILGAYREHLLSPDRTWLARHWPRIRKAVDYVVARWDPDEDGILTGPQWNTLDENLGGSSSWLGSLYVAALMAGERMAALMGEPNPAARWRRIHEASAGTQDATLYNGSYYFQIPEATPYRDYGTGCHIDQALGEWWSRMLDMDRVYSEDRVRSAMRALFENNFRYNFVGVNQIPRKFVHDDDAGMQMITWPKGGRPAPEKQMLYADEVMTGFEYSAAALMIYAGLMQEGLTVARAIADRYDGRLRDGLTASDYSSWGYSGNPFGDDECGKFYARAMSSWSLLLACQGFVYDGPGGVIGFRPRWRPENHVSFFTAAEGWGLFSQKRAKTGQTERIEVRHGRVAIRSLVFEVGDNAEARSARVVIGGKAVGCTMQKHGRGVRVTLARTVLVRAGQEVVVTLGTG